MATRSNQHCRVYRYQCAYVSKLLIIVGERRHRAPESVPQAGTATRPLSYTIPTSHFSCVQKERQRLCQPQPRTATNDTPHAQLATRSRAILSRGHDRLFHREDLRRPKLARTVGHEKRFASYRATEQTYQAGHRTWFQFRGYQQRRSPSGSVAIQPVRCGSPAQCDSANKSEQRRQRSTAIGLSTDQ